MYEKPTYEELERRVQKLEKVETERKQAEEILKEIIAKNPMSIQILDKEGCTLEVNSSYRSLFGSVPPSGYSIFNDIQLLQNGMGKFFEQLKNGEVVRFPDLYFNAHDSFPEFPDVPAWIRTIGFPIDKISEKPERFVLMHENITERKQIEDVLREKESTNSHILDSISDGFFVLDNQLAVTYFNKAAEQILGKKSNEVIGHGLFEVFPEAGGSIFEKKYRFALQTKTALSFETYFDSPPYQNWYDVRVYPYHSGITVFFQLTTERKKKDEILRESEEKFRTLSLLAPAGIYLTDPEGNCLYTNPCWNEMAGFSSKEALGKGWVNALHPEDRETVFSNWEKMVESEGSWGMEYRFQTPEGKVTWIYGLATPQRDVSGKIIRYVGLNMDITERKRSEKQLRQNEENFRQLVENIKEVFWLGSTDWSQVFYVSPAYEEIWGSPRTELYSQPRSWLDKVVAEDVQRLVDVIQAYDPNGKEPIIFPDYRIMRPDGSERWIAARGFRVFNFDSQSYRIAGLAEDITERKQAEEILQKTQEQLTNAHRLAQIGIWDWIADTDTVTWTEELYHIAGIDPKWPAPTYAEHPNLYAPESWTRLKAAAEKSLETGTPYQLELELFRPDGSIRWVKAFGGAIYDDRRQVKGLHGTVQDITERKLAEANLKMAHEKMLTILESIDSTVYVADMDTHEILFMNKKMITDFSGDKTGEICFSAFRKKSEPCEFCTNDQLLDKNGNPCGVCTWHDQNPITGRFYINHDRAIEWLDGRMVRLQIATDITDMKKMEAQLTQAQKMESIGTLAGGIAHDFNNILFPIVGHTEMLMDDLSEESSSIRESLNQIYTGALRARDLVQQILTFAHQEKNELKLMKMQPVIKEAIKLIRSAIPTTISITQNLQPGCGPVTADPTQIHQILMNLATNAYHAMEKDGGELKVNLKEIELGKRDLIDPDMSPGLYACLTIGDTGVGMNKDVMNRIFDPFFTTKEKGKGTGMGLSVVHGIVKRMKGEIQVYSEPGKGTEFQVYLPIARDSSERQEQNANESIVMGSERVLLVDDEAAIIIMEKMILERLGYQVTSRTSSIEALETFKADPDKFDLVITDMSMPKMSGDKLAVELIRIRTDIPILLFTGYSESMTDEKIKSLGIKGFLMKPIERKALAKKIREILD